MRDEVDAGRVGASPGVVSEVLDDVQGCNKLYEGLVEES